MTAVYIISAVLLFLIALSFVRAGAVIKYDGDLAVTVTVCGIPFRIIPGKEKKIRPSDWSVKKIAARRRKSEKAARRKAAKAAKAAEKAKKDRQAEKKKEKPDILRIVKTAFSALSVAARRFSKHLRVRVARLHIAVATGDAASTAILYGAISQAAFGIAALLDSAGNLRGAAQADVDIHADYLSEKTSADVEVGFSLLVWQMFDLILRTGFTALKTYFAEGKKSGGSKNKKQ
ncbi:MAG: DUF2953 domain-containing protein [Clostridia bacterium]|nr:DUF2953 domain-containing protein [Clostridia bacterium]